jgi:hypothetical protein
LVAKRHVRPFEDDGYSGATNEKRRICERSRVNYQHPKILFPSLYITFNGEEQGKDR